MYVRMYLCVYVCIHVCKHLCMQWWKTVLKLVSLYVCSMYLCVYACIHVYKHLCMQWWKTILKLVSLYVCTYVFMCVCVHTCIYIYKHLCMQWWKTVLKLVSLYVCTWMQWTQQPATPYLSFLSMQACRCSITCMYVCIYACMERERDHAAVINHNMYQHGEYVNMPWLMMAWRVLKTCPCAGTGPYPSTRSWRPLWQSESVMAFKVLKISKCNHDTYNVLTMYTWHV